MIYSPAAMILMDHQRRQLDSIPPRAQERSQGNPLPSQGQAPTRRVAPQGEQPPAVSRACPGATRTDQADAREDN
jgi:hypothetical protein